MRTTTPPDLAVQTATTDSGNADSALQSTRSAIARWTNGIHVPQMLVPGMVRVSPQARWYSQANRGFQEWVNQGGFAQACDCPDTAAETADKLTARIRSKACID